MSGHIENNTTVKKKANKMKPDKISSLSAIKILGTCIVSGTWHSFLQLQVIKRYIWMTFVLSVRVKFWHYVSYSDQQKQI